MNKLVKLNLIVWSLVSILFAVALTGCSSSTGFDVHFGITPVSYVNNQQGLVKSNGGAILPASEKNRY